MSCNNCGKPYMAGLSSEVVNGKFFCAKCAALEVRIKTSKEIKQNG